MKIKFLLIAFLALGFIACEEKEKIALIEDIELCVQANRGICPDNKSTFSTGDSRVTAAVIVTDAAVGETVTFDWTYLTDDLFLTSATVDLVAEAGNADSYNAAGFIEIEGGGLPAGEFRVEATLSSGISISRTFIVR